MMAYRLMHVNMSKETLQLIEKLNQVRKVLGYKPIPAGEYITNACKVQLAKDISEMRDTHLNINGRFDNLLFELQNID